MLGFQAKGACPIVKGKLVKKPKTIATAIKIGDPASWREAVAARDESHGLIDAVSDAEILAAYKFLAQKEGVFCEPASAASVAGLFLLAKRNFFRAARRLTVVCTLTGHGLKDPQIAISNIQNPPIVEPTLDAVRAAAGL